MDKDNEVIIEYRPVKEKLRNIIIIILIMFIVLIFLVIGTIKSSYNFKLVCATLMYIFLYIYLIIYIFSYSIIITKDFILINSYRKHKKIILKEVNFICTEKERFEGFGEKINGKSLVLVDEEQVYLTHFELKPLAGNVESYINLIRNYNPHIKISEGARQYLK